MYLDMERKLCKISDSLVVTIPKQVCDLYGFKDGDMIEILLIDAN